MSSLLNKAKDAMGKSGGSGGSGGSAPGQQSSVEKGVSGQAHTRTSSPLHTPYCITVTTSLTSPPPEIDNLTDRAGMGDKYDDKINKLGDGQINNQGPGGAGSK